jgi:hypothetical protein
LVNAIGFFHEQPELLVQGLVVDLAGAFGLKKLSRGSENCRDFTGWIHDFEFRDFAEMIGKRAGREEILKLE